MKEQLQTTENDIKEGELEGLIINDYSGRKSILPEEDIVLLTSELERIIYPSAIAFIYYVEKRFKERYSASGMTELLHRIGFSYKEPKGVSGKADKNKQEEFLKKYNELKQKYDHLYFADSTHPQHNSILSHGWIKKGTDKEVLTNSGRNHINLNGVVNIANKDVIVRFSPAVNAVAIEDLLYC